MIKIYIILYLLISIIFSKERNPFNHSVDYMTVRNKDNSEFNINFKSEILLKVKTGLEIKNYVILYK